MEKARLHPRNKNRARYDLVALSDCQPALKQHLARSKSGANSVDFSSAKAVKLLNTAILNYYYGVKMWDFPAKNLCPPIPGRADYIHYLADLLADSNDGQIPTGHQIKGLDIGTGASCIYPIIGVIEYKWQFVATDISAESIASAEKIVASNKALKGKIDCRLQSNAASIFKGVIGTNERFDFTMCNPPFHASAEEATKGSKRKTKNLGLDKTNLNFAGVSNELLYEGGEYQFIKNMIRDSKDLAKNCYWFSTLVSKKANLKGIYQLLKTVKAKKVKTIPMGTGNKISRIVAWTFLSEAEEKEWVAKHR